MAYQGEAKRKYQRDWMEARRNDWIESQGGCCAECGSVENLEVDHIDPSKKTREPRDIWSRTASVREAELALCQVLCAECHKAKTAAEQSHEDFHGTSAGYDKRKCRCDKCRAHNTARRRDYRARQRAILASA